MILISVGSRVEFGNRPFKNILLSKKKKPSCESKQKLFKHLNCAHNNEYLFKVNSACIIFYAVLVHCS